MRSLDHARQASDLLLLEQGHEFAFGDPGALPLSPAVMAALAPASPGVEAEIGSGLTARVLRLRHGAQAWAVKIARPACLVRNVDGQTSFLNELRRHAELAALRGRGTTIAGVLYPHYASLRHGLIVSRWIDGTAASDFDERSLEQIYRTGCELALNGFFEWDYSPGNVIDDGERLWLFDFGYMYRFDPLTQLNSAGGGLDHTGFHPAERIETRNLFGWLLRSEAAHGMAVSLARFAQAKSAAVQAYAWLHRELKARGASARVLDHYDGIARSWRNALDGDLATLYLAEGWRSHRHDLDDDLSGQTCTEGTLARADWLIATALSSFDALRASAALSAAEHGLDQHALVAACRQRRERAAGYLMDTRVKEMLR
jgi:hypothetical protein